MAEPNLNVEFSAVTDEKGKFRRLAKLLGLADADHARGKCEHLWLACTRRGETDLPQWLVEEILGERGPAALVDAELARWTSGRGDSKTRRMRISGARKHCTWLTSKTEQSSNAGKSNARTANRVRGKFAAKPTIENHPSDSDSDPIPEDQNSLPPARDPAVPAPEPTPAPTAPPAPLLPGPLVTTPNEIRAELERATPAPTVPPGESGWHRRLRWWGAMLEADARIRAAGIEPNAPALPKAPAGVHEQNMLRCERQILDGGATPAEADAKMRHVVLVAEAEAMRSDNRSRRWFKPALIWDPERAARAVDTSLAEASKPRVSTAARELAARYGVKATATAPAPRARETALPVVVSDAERAEAAEMALELRARLFGEARAPPAPASSSPTPDQQPTPAKAPT